jgi:hypothetical protein
MRKKDITPFYDDEDALFDFVAVRLWLIVAVVAVGIVLIIFKTK